MDSNLAKYKECIEVVAAGYRRCLAESYRTIIGNMVVTDKNKDIYCFLLKVFPTTHQIQLSINAESTWNSGYGSTDDIDPSETTLQGLRYNAIGYVLEPECQVYEDGLDEIRSELFQLTISTDDTRLKKAAEKLLDDMPVVLQDIAVGVLEEMDFSLVNKTDRFCAYVLDEDLSLEEQTILAKRTVKKNFAEIFPIIEQRQARTVDPEILALPPAEQAQKLVEYIIYHHCELDIYEGSRRFDILLDAEQRLIQLRPDSDTAIAAAFNELGPQVEAYDHGTPEHEQHGFYNQQVRILDALLDMASHSEEPLTPVLDQALNRHLAFLKQTKSEYDAQCLSTSVELALYLWGEGRYSSPV